MRSPTKREGPGAGANREPPFEPKPGFMVAEKYRIDAVLGEGGMGIVVAATHVGLEQRVAIKFLHPHATRNAEAVERFQREAKVAAKVTSEHVARVSDIGTIEAGSPFIVMEYLEGADLGVLLDKGGKLSIGDACEIVLQACEALAQVHTAGIVHRDLKPSNLFVTRRTDGSPCVKLLDFGISKFSSNGDEDGIDPALTATAAIMGSPSYMSPEQLKSTKEVDARTDVWSLGAVLYEALTGKRAFGGETVPQVCARIASEEPPPPSSLREGVPRDIERAVLACLVKNPEERATLVELARALVDFAPARAHASLERVEAVLGNSVRRRAPSTVAAQPPEVARTQSSWGEDNRSKRGVGGTLALLAFLVAAVLGVGIKTGKVDLNFLRGQAASATSAMSSAVASAVPMPSAVPPVESIVAPIASALAPIASAVAPIASAFDDSESTDPDGIEADEEDAGVGVRDAEADGVAMVSRVLAVQPHGPAAKHPQPRPKHGWKKVTHKHH